MNFSITAETDVNAQSESTDGHLLLSETYPQLLHRAHVHNHNGFIDAHAHVFHDEFKGDEELIVNKCFEKGLDLCIVSMLEVI